MSMDQSLFIQLGAPQENPRRLVIALTTARHPRPYPETGSTQSMPPFHFLKIRFNIIPLSA